MEQFLVPNLPFFLPLGPPFPAATDIPDSMAQAKKFSPPPPLLQQRPNQGSSYVFIGTKLAPSGLYYIISREGLGQLF